MAGDGTVTLTNKELATAAVNGADEGWEFNAVGDRAGVNIDAVDLAVLGAREELALGESESADEALVDVKRLLTLATVVATPDVDLSIGATGVASSVAVPSRAGERGLLV